MHKAPSFFRRIAIAKIAGLLYGLFVVLALFMTDTSASFTVKLGFAFWFITLGAIIGLAGIYTRHPAINIPLTWFMRGAFMGAWLNLLVAIFAQDMIIDITEKMTDGDLTSPYWFVLEGAIVGLLIDFIATKFGGEGIDSLKNDYK